MQNTSDRTVTRVRHTLKFRLLQVLRVHTVTPHLLRVTLGGPISRISNPRRSTIT